MNRFKFSDDNKRYHTFNYYLRNKYQSKVFKVSLNANFTCPNRDGSKGYGGCYFCSQTGSGDFAGDVRLSLLQQFSEIKTKMHLKWPSAKYIAYFQAFSNTYADLATLKQTYEPVLEMENVVALSIATRPDCLEPETIEYLNELSKSIDVWIELGLQTTFDETARNFNRGYDYEVFLDTITALSKTNINVCVHIINGLENETREMMIENAKKMAKLPIDALKIHMLHIVSDSIWGQRYLKKPYELLSRDEYVDIVVEQLKYLPKEMIIQRLTGDGNPDYLLAPEWTKKKTIVLNEVDKLMSKLDVCQGDLYE